MVYDIIVINSHQRTCCAGCLRLVKASLAVRCQIVDTRNRHADALEVSAAQLIGDGAASLKMSRKAGPIGRVQKVFEEVSGLPRRQQ
jgi:hypothetical protein